jgi:hypothetical protein
MSRSSTSIRGAAGVATSASFASGVDVLDTCQEFLPLGLIMSGSDPAYANQMPVILVGNSYV